MVDILVLCLPGDRDRASVIPDALIRSGVAGSYRTRFLSPEPDGTGWAEAVQAAAAAPCTIFCWSHAAQRSAAEPMRQLGGRALANRTALSVELDQGATPPSMAGSTIYPLHGWRARPGALGLFVFGRGFATDIAAAAQEKVIGRDPPPPSAYWRLIRRQAWIAGGTLAFALGIVSTLWGFYRDPAVARAVDREAAAAFRDAEQSRSCEKLRDFAHKHGGSAWSDRASELLATCVTRPVTTVHRVEQPIELFEMEEAGLQAEGQRKCEGVAQAANATLVAARVEAIDRGCDPGVCARAICTLDQPVTEEREVMAGAD